MRSGYDLSEDAREDLRNIWEFIAEDSLDAADRVIAELFEAFEGLVKMPGKGHQRQDLTDKPVLFWPVRSYLIIYRPDKDPLEVIGVMHGARDIPSIIRKR